MHISKEKPILRLVKSATRPAATAGRGESAPLTPRASAYYQRIEAYARKIRRTEDVNVIILILDEALRETGKLHGDYGAQLAREKVMRAEHRIEELKQEMEQLRTLIHIDHLTGAMNRGGLDQAFRRETANADRHGAPLGIALIDIDNFKILNDTHGHQAGDAALVHLSQIMMKALRPGDTLVRFGGEEFLILFPHSALAQARQALQRLQDELARLPFICQGKNPGLTFSAGVTMRKPGEAQASVIGRADQALYEAKRTGKQRVVALD